jgi:hypothetical protein
MFLSEILVEYSDRSYNKLFVWKVLHGCCKTVNEFVWFAAMLKTVENPAVQVFYFSC